MVLSLRDCVKAPTKSSSKQKKLKDKEFTKLNIVKGDLPNKSFLKSLRRITRWEVYALYLLCLYLTITPTILETPRSSGVPVCIADSRGVLAFSQGLWLFAPTLRIHRRDSIIFYSTLYIVLHARCSSMTGGESVDCAHDV